MDNRAKEMFFKYKGSHCQMENDGVLEKYKAYGISSEQEKQWTLEIEQQEIIALSNSSDKKSAFVLLCMTVRKTKDPKTFEMLYQFLLSEKAVTPNPVGRLYMISSFVDLMRTFKDKMDLTPYKAPVLRLISSIQGASDDPEVQRRAPLISTRLKRL